MEKTIENLTKAFVGECQARNRYSFYASIAKKEGYEKIAEIFNITADQEKQHAKWLFRLINQIKPSELTETKVETEVPLIFGNTIENLESAIKGENYEHKEMYPQFAKIALEENHPEISQRLDAIAKAEEHHEERYNKILKQLKEKTIFKKSDKVWWICRECGYHFLAAEPPEMCPSCDHPKSYFELKCEEY